MTLNRISQKRKAIGEKRMHNSTFARKKTDRKKKVTSIDDLITQESVKKASATKRKPTGQAKVFREIWDIRPHQCEVCEVPIIEARASNFSHLLPKGSYPSMMLNPRNIVLKCVECHNLWHQENPDALRQRQGWSRIIDLYEKLRFEYNQGTSAFAKPTENN